MFSKEWNFKLHLYSQVYLRGVASANLVTPDF